MLDATFADLVPSPVYDSEIISKYQSTNDIIKDLIHCFKAYNSQGKTLSKYLYCGNIDTDAKNIYDFVKNNFIYSEEPAKEQTTRSFSRIIHDNSPIDCKHQSLLSSILAWNMGYNVFFKFVSYYDGQTFGHVYVVIQDKDTKEKIIIDPLQKFNSERPFKKKFFARAFQNRSIKPIIKENNMTLTRLSGNNCILSEQDAAKRDKIYVDGVGQIILTNLDEVSSVGKIDLKKAAQTIVNKIKQATTSVQEAAKKASTPVKVIALAPIRAAGLALFALNFRNFAGRFSKLDVATQKKFSDKFGFNYNDLMKSVNTGKGKKPVLGGKVSGYDVSGIGVVVSTAAIAAAAPLILALVEIFKQKGLSEPTDSADTAQSTSDILKTTGQKTSDILDIVKDENYVSESDKGFIDKMVDSVKQNPVLYIGGTAVLLYFGKKFYKLKTKK